MDFGENSSITGNKSINRKKSKFTILAVVGLFVLWLPTFTCFFILIHQDYSAYWWINFTNEKTNAKIVNIDFDDRTALLGQADKFFFEYNINGENIISHSYDLDTPLQIGNTVNIQYNKKHPEYAKIIGQKANKMSFVSLIISALVVILWATCLLTLIIAGIKQKRMRIEIG